MADAFERVNVIGLPARWSELDRYGERKSEVKCGMGRNGRRFRYAPVMFMDTVSAGMNEERRLVCDVS